MANIILVLNPGSTSTKVAVFDDAKQRLSVTIRHDAEELKKFNWVMEQVDYRRNIIVNALKEKHFDLSTLTAICARGGMVPLCPSGAFVVSKEMIDYMYSVKHGHVSNIGCVIAYELAKPLNIPAYIYDPVSVDELQPVAKICGIPELRRISRGHALNTRAMAIKCARERLGKSVAECTFIVVHIGGGTSVRLIDHGITIDANSDDDGCMSLERAGNVAAVPLIEMCYSGKYTESQMMKKIRGNGGLKAHLGTSDALEIQERIEKGDEKAKLLYEAMAYTIAKDIGAMATVVSGKVDRIIITGGVANSKMMVNMISKQVSFIAPIELMPGEFEMEAMAEGTLRVLSGEEEAHPFVAN